MLQWRVIITLYLTFCIGSSAALAEGKCVWNGITGFDEKPGYTIARQCPGLLKHLFCYCGCDMTDHKQSLFDCFTDSLAMDDPVCQWEAELAYKLLKEGKSLTEIQSAVDAQFSKHYPFESPSKELRNYQKKRDNLQRKIRLNLHNHDSRSTNQRHGEGKKSSVDPKSRDNYDSGNSVRVIEIQPRPAYGEIIGK